MKKRIQSYGSSLIIRLSPEDCMIYSPDPNRSLEKGDIIKMCITEVVRPKKKGGKNETNKKP